MFISNDTFFLFMSYANKFRYTTRAFHLIYHTYFFCIADLRFSSNAIVFYCKHAFHEDCLPAHNMVRTSYIKVCQILVPEWELVLLCGAILTPKLSHTVTPLFLIKQPLFHISLQDSCMICSTTAKRGPDMFGSPRK